MIHNCFQKKSLLIFQVTHKFKRISFNSIPGINIQDYNPSFAEEEGLYGIIKSVFLMFKIFLYRNIPIGVYYI
ncbi:hypothetical protein VL14_04220 [Cytobacillus firmus]|nr:hypothetical protein VL14_04220 [Cytobacillus firmus]